MLEKDLEDMKKTGSLKNITNITNKIQLTKRARFVHYALFQNSKTF